MTDLTLKEELIMFNWFKKAVTWKGLLGFVITAIVGVLGWLAYTLDFHKKVKGIFKRTKTYLTRPDNDEC